MRFVKSFCCAAALAAVTVTPAFAQGWNTEWSKKTFLTFSGPVQIPGKTLDAGTYTFQLADLISNRHVVKIYDKDGAKLIATVMTVPQTTTKPSEKNIVMFNERPAGAAPAIKTWFYPAATIGDEFVYPRSQAIQIAKSSGVAVLSSPDAGTEAEMKDTTIARVDGTGAVVNDDMSVSHTEPAPQSAPAVGTTGQTNAASEVNAAPRRAALPRTASPLALFELLSAASLAAFAGTRKLRKRFDA